MSFRAAVLMFGGGVLMSKKRPQIHLNVAELVLFDNDMTPIQPKTGSCMKARPKGYLSRESQKSWRKTPRLCVEDMECLLM